MLNCVSDSAAVPHIEASIKRHQCVASQRKWALLSLFLKTPDAIYLNQLMQGLDHRYQLFPVNNLIY